MGSTASIQLAMPFPSPCLFDLSRRRPTVPCLTHDDSSTPLEATFICNFEPEPDLNHRTIKVAISMAVATAKVEARAKTAATSKTRRPSRRGCEMRTISIANVT
jgi:hypothetical protein